MKKNTFFTKCFRSAAQPKVYGFSLRLRGSMTINDQKRRAVCNELARANLGICFTHAGLAKCEFEAGKRSLAERSFGLARSSHDAMQRFLGQVEDEGQRHEVQAKLHQLREKLDLLQRQLHPEPA
jgi:hypothetical protein